jgi:hypothetical protein
MPVGPGINTNSIAGNLSFAFNYLSLCYTGQPYNYCDFIFPFFYYLFICLLSARFPFYTFLKQL